MKTFTEKARGLIGTRSPFGIYFRTRWGIHTFGMEFPIDVIIADKNFRVKNIREGLLPYRFFFWNPAWVCVFELPAGTIKKIKIQKGDELELRG